MYHSSSSLTDQHMDVKTSCDCLCTKKCEAVSNKTKLRAEVGSICEHMQEYRQHDNASSGVCVRHGWRDKCDSKTTAKDMSKASEGLAPSRQCESCEEVKTSSKHLETPFIGSKQMFTQVIQKLMPGWLFEPEFLMYPKPKDKSNKNV